MAQFVIKVPGGTALQRRKSRGTHKDAKINAPATAEGSLDLASICIPLTGVLCASNMLTKEKLSLTSCWKIFSNVKDWIANHLRYKVNHAACLILINITIALSLEEKKVQRHYHKTLNKYILQTEEIWAKFIKRIHMNAWETH